MSATLMGAVFYVRLSQPEKSLLVAMADHADDDGYHIFPGNERLATKISRSERTVRRLLRSLEDQGIIGRVAYPTGGRGHAVEWAINADWVYEEARRGGWTTQQRRTSVATFTKRPEPQRRTLVTVKEDTGDPPTIRKHHEEGTKRSLPISLSSAPVSKTPRPRDLIWDTLAGIFGEPSNDGTRGKRNLAVRLLRQSDATPEEIVRRVQAWPGLYGAATLTDKALADHWDALGRAPMRVTAETAARLDLERESVERLARLEARYGQALPTLRALPSIDEKGV